MDYSMKVPQWKFEEELESLLNAARSTNNKDTARGYLNEAWSKADRYCNVSPDLSYKYKRMVEDVAEELEINI